MPQTGTLEGRGLTKRFGGVTALDAVDFAVSVGQVTALLGENGAGKSTLVACLSGALRPDQGEVLVGGETRRFRSPDDARRAGIAVVHQEPQMLEDQSVAANIYLSRLARRRNLAWSGTDFNDKAAEHLRLLGISELEPDRPMHTVAGAQRQLVEIARALISEPTALFLDEPNASLGEEDTQRLFEVVRGLRRRGVGVVLVSHRLREVYEIADHIVVMRDGHKVADDSAAQLPLRDAVRFIMGDAKGPRAAPVTAGPALVRDKPGQPILDVSGLSGPGFDDVSFRISAGEIVGMAGLVGSGRTEIAHAVIGASKSTQGSIQWRGRPTRFADPADAVRQGVAFVPEGRRDAVFYGQSVDFNIRAAMWGRRSSGVRRLRRRDAGARVNELMRQLAVKAPNAGVRASTLSGGNQQKLLFARALGTRPALLILDEPTHGVDVGTKGETHDLIRRLAGEGMAVWFISSEVEEIVELSQRTLVVRQGRVVGDLPGGSTTEEILARSFGAVDALQGESA